MKKFVYLAGPIEDCDDSEIHDWRNYVSKNLVGNVVGISPYRGPETKDNGYTAQVCKSIRDKNLLDSKSCDALLAYMPSEIIARRPSYGTTFEVAWFDYMQKPIVVVTDDEFVQRHPLFKASVGWYYDNFDDAIEMLNVLLGVYSNG